MLQPGVYTETRHLVDSTQMETPDIISGATRGGSFGYKLVGDNLDMSINARYIQSEGHQNQSCHFFHSLAVLDRINFSALSTHLQPTCNNSPLNMALSLVPSTEDDVNLLQNIATYISRVLVTYMSFFKFTFSDVTTWHIQHKFYKEMSKKSEVVSTHMLILSTFEYRY